MIRSSNVLTTLDPNFQQSNEYVTALVQTQLSTECISVDTTAKLHKPLIHKVVGTRGHCHSHTPRYTSRYTSHAAPPPSNCCS